MIKGLYGFTRFPHDKNTTNFLWSKWVWLPQTIKTEPFSRLGKIIFYLFHKAAVPLVTAVFAHVPNFHRAD
jgi:hypothetical protein